MTYFRFCWLLVSVGWLFLLPIQSTSSPWRWCGLVTLAWGLAAAGVQRHGLLELKASGRRRLLTSVLFAAALVLTVCLVQAWLLNFYYKAASVYHSAGALAPVVAGLLKLFGFEATWQGQTVFLQTRAEVIPFAVTLEKLALLPLLFFLIAEALTLFIFGVRGLWRRLLPTALLILAYGVARLFAVCVLYVSVKQVWMFWEPLVLLGTLLPLPLLLMRLNPVTLPALGRTAAWRPGWRRAVAGFALVVVATTGVAIFWTFQDPGYKKQGRVIIDELHSNWAWTTRPFDKEWFGQQSVYNYYVARSFANQHFDVRVNTDRPIGDQLLSDCDVLVIKTPTKEFSGAEKDSIERFVRGGGGLFLVGDHTNLFGMSVHLNELAEPYNIEFNFDDTYDLTNGQPSNYSKPRLFYHPIVRDIDDFGFETSCSLDAPLSSDFVMVGYGLGREWVDYGHKNFFGNMTLDPGEDFGLFVQAAAAKHGKGRVVTFSDSTVFSNFSFSWPGKAELFVGSLDYLNRSNKYGDVINLLGLFVGLLAAAAFVWLLTRGQSRALLPAFTLAGALATLGVTLFVNHLNAGNYPTVKPRTEFTTVAFETEYSNIGLVEKDSLVAEQTDGSEYLEQALEGDKVYPDWETFRTFFVNMARLGVHPVAKKSFNEALQVAQVVVVINPHKPFSTEDQRQLHHFLEHGGRLLLMDSVTNNNVYSNQLLKGFNAQIDVLPDSLKVFIGKPEVKPDAKTEPKPEGETVPKPSSQSDGARNPAVAPASQEAPAEGVRLPQRELKLPQLAILGEGKTIFSGGDQRVFAKEIKHEKGSIVVFVDSAYFSNAFMGRVYEKPDEKSLPSYQDMFWLFENYLLRPAPQQQTERAANTDTSGRQ